MSSQIKDALTGNGQPQQETASAASQTSGQSRVEMNTITQQLHENQKIKVETKNTTANRRYRSQICFTAEANEWVRSRAGSIPLKGTVAKNDFTKFLQQRFPGLAVDGRIGQSARNAAVRKYEQEMAHKASLENARYAAAYRQNQQVLQGNLPTKQTQPIPKELKELHQVLRSYVAKIVAEIIQNPIQS